MRTIEERLDKIRKLMEDDDFLESKGISNEVNIRIFCYDPEDEMAVRHFISQIKTDQDLHCNLIERNLYEIFLAACDDIGITDSIAEMEESDGGPFLLEQLHAAIGVDDFVARIDDQPHNPGDVLLLTGIGAVSVHEDSCAAGSLTAPFPGCSNPGYVPRHIRWPPCQTV